LVEQLRWSESAAHALLKNAMAFLAEFHLKAGSLDCTLADLHAPEDRINEAFVERDMFALRIVVREWVEAELSSF
jgi:hypothetical protein